MYDPIHDTILQIPSLSSIIQNRSMSPPLLCPILSRFLIAKENIKSHIGNERLVYSRLRLPGAKENKQKHKTVEGRKVETGPRIGNIGPTVRIRVQFGVRFR